MIKAVTKFLSSHTKYSICGMSGLWISCKWLKFKILPSVILQLVALQGPGVTRGNYRVGNNLEKKLKIYYDTNHSREMEDEFSSNI